MAYETLTLTQLNKILFKTSPYSLRFNVTRQHEDNHLPINVEPTLDPELIGSENLLRRLAQYRNALISARLQADDLTAKYINSTCNLDCKCIDCTDMLVDLAYMLGEITAYTRSEAMRFGINLEDVLEGVVAHKLNTPAADHVDPRSTVKTIMFGVKPETQ